MSRTLEKSKSAATREIAVSMSLERRKAIPISADKWAKPAAMSLGAPWEVSHAAT
jgi:hypothetical protein